MNNTVQDINRKVPLLLSHTRWRKIGEETVVLNQESAEVLVVNEMGARVLELVAGRHSVKEMVETLSSVYLVEPDVLERDINEYLDELGSAGIVGFSSTDTP
jgi:hypothetical protein